MNYARKRPAYVAAHRADLLEVLSRQVQGVKSTWQQTGSLSVAVLFDRARWDKTLADRLFVRTRLTALDFGSAVATDLGGSLDPADVDDFLLTSAGIGAANINASTERRLGQALEADAEERDGAIDDVLGALTGYRLDTFASSTVATSANFGMTKGAESAGAAGKIWVVNSANPRLSHAEIDGEKAGFGDAFSNGMQWPGDPAGGADEVAGCTCSVDFEGAG